jgi:diguanylate cyclase (GGDEF)-like protein
LPDVGFFYGLTTQTNELQKLPVTDLSGNRENIIWWNEPTKEGKAVWIAPHYHSNSDILMVSYVSPIYKDNTLIGVAGMDIELSLLLNVVKGITPYENGYAYLLSRTGKELYHPYETSAPGTSDREIITANSKLDNGMTLVVCAYYDDIQSQGNRMVIAMLMISFCVVALFIILTVIVTKRITDPLRRLAQVESSMDYGMEFVELECDLKDEIGVLYKVFNNSNHQLYEYMSSVQTQVYRDSLTGLKNNAAYAEAVISMEKRISEEEPKFGVAIFDMNNLKVVNDTYGHNKGSELIVRVSKLIAGVFYRSIIYRVGGDEFVVILEDDDYGEYESLIEAFDKLCADEHFAIDDANIPISVAYGVAIYDKEIDSNYENVFHRADGLMYRKKREMKVL